MFDAIFVGTPGAFPAGANTVEDGVDKSTGAPWNTATGVWAPSTGAFQRNRALAQTAAAAALLTFTAPITGLYRVTGYVTQATATNGTLPNVQVAWTEAETGATEAATTFVTGTATTGLGQYDQGTLIINALGGSTVTISTTAPTTLTYNAKVRAEYLG